MTCMALLLLAAQSAIHGRHQPCHGECHQCQSKHTPKHEVAWLPPSVTFCRILPHTAANGKYGDSANESMEHAERLHLDQSTLGHTSAPSREKSMPGIVVPTSPILSLLLSTSISNLPGTATAPWLTSGAT